MSMRPKFIAYSDEDGGWILGIVYEKKRRQVKIGGPWHWRDIMRALLVECWQCKRVRARPVGGSAAMGGSQRGWMIGHVKDQGLWEAGLAALQDRFRTKPARNLQRLCR